MNKIIELYRGTSIESGKRFLNGDINKISWWSHDFETIEHYYEGCVIKMTIELIDYDKVNIFGLDYISDYDDLDAEDIDDYEYGFAVVDYPEDAIWYSISDKYIKEHCLNMEEIELKDIRI